jgi:hypothetical protein
MRSTSLVPRAGSIYFAAGCKVLMTTGARRSEIFEAQRSWLDVDRRCLRAFRILTECAVARGNWTGRWPRILLDSQVCFMDIIALQRLTTSFALPDART